MKIFKQKKQHRTQEITNHSVTLDHKCYPFTLTRKDIKHTYIKIKPTGLFVTTNHYASMKQIQALLRKHKDSIIQKLNTIEASKTEPLGKNQLFYLGKLYTVKEEVTNDELIELNHADQLIIVNREIRKQVIETFYKKQAHKVFNERLSIIYEEHFKKFHIRKPLLKIRKMKSRYGTCYYNDQKIILNALLIQCDVSHIDYVIAHELCHFLYHDHGKGFKTLLSRVIPDWRERKQSLNNQFARLST